MRISVVIPTRDRPGSLARCLAALAAQSASFELVVVDDGSHDRDALATVVAEAAIDPPPRVLRTPGRGPAAARNLGLRAARGEVVLFTDDDCEPEPGWVAALAAATGAGTAAGRTVTAPGAPRRVVASQAITEHLQLASRDPEGAGLGFAPSCNLAARAAALARLPFAENYPGAAGEDRDWCARAVAAGLAPTYAETAVVVHHPALGLAGFARQQFRYGRGAARFHAARGRGPAPVRFYAGLLRAGFARGPLVGALVGAAQVVVAVGFAVERLGTRRG